MVFGELCLLVVKVGGVFLVYKVSVVNDELKLVIGVINKLGG